MSSIINVHSCTTGKTWIRLCLLYGFSFDRVFCTLRGVLKFSEGTVGGYRSICVYKRSSLHWWGISELLPCFFFAVNAESQTCVWIYGTEKSQILTYWGKRKKERDKLKSSEPRQIFVVFFFFYFEPPNDSFFVCLVNKLRRIEFSTASLLKVAPTAEERNIVHQIFLNTLDTRQEGEGWRRTEVLWKRKVRCLLSRRNRVAWNKCMHFIFPFHYLNSLGFYLKQVHTWMWQLHLLE